jgi:hypothetical protein
MPVPTSLVTHTFWGVPSQVTVMQGVDIGHCETSSQPH